MNIDDLKNLGRDDVPVKDAEGRDAPVKDSGGRDAPVKDAGGRGDEQFDRQGMFGGGGCLAVVAFIGPVGMNVGQLAARMLSGGGPSGSRGTGKALANVAAQALVASRQQDRLLQKEHTLAKAYQDMQKAKAKNK